jgi:hypothetical protein
MIDATTYAECIIALSTPWAPAHQLAFQAIQAIALIPLEGREESEWMEDVRGVFLAVYPHSRQRLFALLDEGATTYGATCDVNGEPVEWHWRLRRTRNHPVAGPALFKIVLGAA